MIWRISSLRPEIGSISFLRARSVKSTENLASASPFPIAAGAMPPLAALSDAGPAAVGRAPASGEPFVIAANSSVRRSPRSFSNSRDIAISALRSTGVFTAPTMRYPVRTCVSPNRRLP